MTEFWRDLAQHQLAIGGEILGASLAGQYSGQGPFSLIVSLLLPRLSIPHYGRRKNRLIAFNGQLKYYHYWLLKIKENRSYQKKKCRYFATWDQQVHH